MERAAGLLLFTGLEPSVLRPVSLTYAVLPALHEWQGLLQYSVTGRTRELFPVP